MTVEPTYRPNYKKHYVLMRQWSGVIGPAGAHTLLDASLVLDTCLQAIADAPRCEHGFIDEHDYLTESTSPTADMWIRCQGAPELLTLLDALTEENE